MRTLLHVCQPTTEGAAVVVRDLSRAAVQAGYRVIVASPPGGDLPGWARAAGAEWHEVPMTRSPDPSDLRAVLTLRRLIRTADVVHLHSSKAGAVGRAAARLLRRPPRIIFTPHGWSWYVSTGRRGRLFRLIEWVLAPTADVITVVSRDELRAGEDALGSRATFALIQNWVDTETFAPRGRVAERGEGRLLLQVGRLCHQKGQDRSIRALAQLADSATRLRLVGDGPDRDALAILAGQLGVAARVEFVGTDAPAPHMRAADVLLLPSRWEGMSLVLLEAMATGLPVISSACGGSDLLESVGDIVPDGSEDEFVAGLVDALDRLPADTEQRAAQGRAIVLNEHTVEHAAKRYLTLWSQ